MKKVLCVANFLFGSASGAQSLARTHVQALYQAFGKENIIVFALVGTENITDQKDIQIKKVELAYSSAFFYLYMMNYHIKCNT